MPSPLTAAEKFAMGAAVHSYEAAQRISDAIESEDGGGSGAGVNGPLNTAVSTVGAATLTAAAIVGGVITRSGSVAAYSDTLPTALLLVAEVPTFVEDMSWLLYIKNTTAFPETILTGVGVTLSGNVVIPPNSIGQFLVTLTSATTATVVGIGVFPNSTSTPITNTAITTVGAGTLTAAGIVGRVITRSGSTADYTDTLATAALIIAALPNASIGQAWELIIKNTVAFTQTLASDTGLTLSGLTVIPPLSVGRFLVTYNGTGTVTVVGLETAPLCNLPPSKFTTGSAATFAAGALTGANWVNYTNTGSNATLTVRTAAQMFADIPNAQIGMEYMLAIRNTNATGATITADAGPTVTLTGTMSIAQNVTRIFNVKVVSATAITITSMGILAAGA